MMQTAHSQLFADIAKLRDDLSADIEKVRDDLGADIQKVRDDLSADIQKVRDDLSADIQKVRDDSDVDLGTIKDRLRAVEIDVAAIRAAVIGLDTRTGTVKGSRNFDTEADERKG